MDHRQFSSMSLAPLLEMPAMGEALALMLTDLHHANAFNSPKLALKKGALDAVGTLGQQDGFLGKPKVDRRQSCGAGPDKRRRGQSCEIRH